MTKNNSCAQFLVSIKNRSQARANDGNDSPCLARLTRILFISAAILISPPWLVQAQQGRVDAASGWAHLQAALEEANRPSASASGAEKKQFGEFWLAVANRARDFHEQFPDEERALEARRMEGMALLAAEGAGVAGVEQRLSLVAGRLRSNTNLPTEFRAEIAGTVDFIRALRMKKSRADRLAAVAEVARNLIAEFPDQPQGYQSLLTVALQTEYDATALEITREVLASPAPLELKAAAELYLRRLALVGQPLNSVLRQAGRGDLLGRIDPNKRSVIYLWSKDSPASVQVAESIASDDATMNVLGLCLDQQVANAEAWAIDHRLPGELIYDERGTGGALAQLLSGPFPGQILLIDKNGIIVSSRGELLLLRGGLSKTDF